MYIFAGCMQKMLREDHPSGRDAALSASALCGVQNTDTEAQTRFICGGAFREWFVQEDLISRVVFEQQRRAREE